MRLISFNLTKRKLIFSAICYSLLLFLSLPAHAADIMVQWDRPDGNSVIGYHVYCGKSGTDFKSNLCATVNSANTTIASVTDLESGVEYSFSATSFDSTGNESDFSNTLTVFIPSIYATDDDGDGYTENDGDCNDSDASISPDAVDICGDGIDQDCSGSDLFCDSGTDVKSVLFSDMPGADYPGTVQDTFININREVNVSGSQLNTYTWPVNVPANAILIKFDLSRLPQGAKIQNALLTLYQTDGGGDAYYDVTVHKIVNHNPDLEYANGFTYDGVNPWTANSYRNIPLGQADIAPAESVNHLTLNRGYKGWDVTNMVQDWVDDSASNFGLLLNSDAVASSHSYRFFAANEAGDATQRPSLIVRFTIDTNKIDDDGDGYSENQGDCNDSDASIAPGMNEICGDNIDQDCDGSDRICPEDMDDDGDGYTENQGDCNDGDSSIAPGATEVCGDNIDQNCDGYDQICPADTDDDGDGYTENQGDCNDSDPSVYAGSAEICGDGIDQDCDGRDLSCSQDSGTTTTNTMILGDIPGSDDTKSVQDTFININREVNAALGQLNTYTWPTNAPANAVLIKFDMTQLPKGAKIQSAILTLYQIQAGGDASYDVSVHKIINHNPDLQQTNGYTYDGVNTWTANSYSYNSVPLAQADIAPAEDVNHLDLSLGYKEWDVTGMVQEWVDDSAANFGLLLNSDAVASANSYRFFAATEAGDSAQRPGLEILYSIDSNDADSDADGFSINQGDCNDDDPSIFPGAPEICGDGIDQDCNGMDQQCHTLVLGANNDAGNPLSIQDTFININRGVNEAFEQLNTYTWPTNVPANAVLMKFDLSQLPKDARIQSATLTLYQIKAGGDADYDVSVHKIINHDPDLQQTNGYTYDGVNTWTANSYSYNGIPLAQADIAPAEDVNHLDLSLGHKEWNVTGMVQEWVDDSAANFGLLLNSDAVASANSYRFFAATEAGAPAQRPALEVVYTIE